MKNILIQDNLEALEDNMFIVSADTFKRLNQKTQVITNSAFYSVRNRLSHSLEVASIGKYIAQQVNTELGFDLVNPSTVENVGKIHDLGHSPLGHIGAECMDEIFSKHNVEFEDNANSLIILEKYYPNLSRIAFLSSIKYPFLVGHNTRIPKKGLYKYQVNYIKELETFCAKQNISDTLPLHRTYESSIMELADDIAYLTGDLEDFLLHYSTELETLDLEKIWKEANIDKSFFFNMFDELNRKNIEISTWTMRKMLIRDIIFDIDTNKFKYQTENSLILLKLLRKITFELYILKHSIRPESEISSMFKKYLYKLIDNIENNSFLSKEISSKRILKEIKKSTDKNEKILMLSYAVSEMTDNHLIKRLKKNFLINF